MRHARPDYDRFQDPAGLIPDDEPVFIIRGHDVCGPLAVVIYAEIARHHKASDKLVAACRHQAAQMRSWQLKHGSKVPDMPE